MSGQHFVAVMDTWPPPSRIFGRDIHPALLGTYELEEATDGINAHMARYCLREDEDYRRLVANQHRREIME